MAILKSETYEVGGGFFGDAWHLGRETDGGGWQRSLYRWLGSVEQSHCAVVNLLYTVPRTTIKNLGFFRSPLHVGLLSVNVELFSSDHQSLQFHHETDLERYTFDRQGYLHIPSLLAKQEASAMYEACLALERDALEIMDRSPRWKDITAGMGRARTWQSERWGYSPTAIRARASRSWWKTSGSSAAISHRYEPTMKFIRRVVQDNTTMQTIPSFDCAIQITTRAFTWASRRGTPRSTATQYRTARLTA